MEVEAKEREESLMSVEIKLTLRGDWCAELFAHSSLFPAYCAHCVFESDPWIEFFSNWFWPEKLAPCCALFPGPAWRSQLDFLHCWSRKSIPGPVVGFISLCCQCLWSWGCERHGAFPAPAGAQAVIVTAKAHRACCLVLEHDISCMVAFLWDCCVLLCQMEQSDFSHTQSMLTFFFFFSLLAPGEYQCFFWLQKHSN